LEVDLVAEVVERILELAHKSLPLDVGEHVANVKEVADKLIQCQVFEKGVSALGLWGMGGIGKSTLAKELYNQLCKGFEASCCIEDVTDKIMQGQGVVEIQKQMLEDLCSFKSKNCNKSELKPILEERLSKKKIVVVLDDVSNVEMLNYMMTREMLKKGSICIVTSRDMRVFEASNIFEGTKQEVYVHEVKMLNMEDSKQVFSSFAFGRDCEMRLKYEEWATKISKCSMLWNSTGVESVWSSLEGRGEFGCVEGCGEEVDLQWDGK
jgi:replication-associated recombination protein RarA